MPQKQVVATSRDWAQLVILALIWGSSFLLIKKALVVYTPIQLVLWRLTFSGLFNLPILYVFWREVNWSKWRPLLVNAMLGSAIPSLLFAVAQKQVESSIAGILNALTPLFTLLISVLLYKSEVKRNQVLGVLLGFFGTAWLIFMDPDTISTNQHSQWFAAFLCVLAALSYAINATTIMHYLQDMHPAAIGAAAFSALLPVFAVGLWWVGGWEQTMQHPDGLRGLTYVAFMSGVGTVIASFLYFGLIQRTGAIFGTSVTYLLPVVSIVIGLFDGEGIHWSDLLGSGLILTALYLVKKAKQ
jgi:drug/metabolite transporter (DMT)-like permease